MMRANGEVCERACALAGFAPRIAHTVDDYDLLSSMVGAGLGVGFVPELGLRAARRADMVVRDAHGLNVNRQVHLRMRAAQAASPRVRAVLALLDESMWHETAPRRAR